MTHDNDDSEYSYVSLVLIHFFLPVYTVQSTTVAQMVKARESSRSESMASVAIPVFTGH